jgi:hypothetical protein
MKATFRVTAFLLSFSCIALQSEAKALYRLKSFVDESPVSNTTNSQLIARGIPNQLLRALNNFRPRRIRAGSTEFSLGRNSLRHILTRHHPDYWDGSSRTIQTFFNRNMTVNDIENAIESVINQNRGRLSRLRGSGTDTVEGVVNGIRYVLRVEKGRVGSFYPKQE